MSDMPDVSTADASSSAAAATAAAAGEVGVTVNVAAGGTADASSSSAAAATAAAAGEVGVTVMGRPATHAEYLAMSRAHISGLGGEAVGARTDAQAANAAAAAAAANAAPTAPAAPVANAAPAASVYVVPGADSVTLGETEQSLGFQQYGTMMTSQDALDLNTKTEPRNPFATSSEDTSSRRSNESAD